MAIKIITPNNIDTEIELPFSKSISNRILILNALSCNDNPVINLSKCEDTEVLFNAFNSESNIFDIKSAGTAMRFLTAFLAGMPGEWIIKGSNRMHERPIYPLVTSLIGLGAEIQYLEKEGFPPLKIIGKQLEGGVIYLSGNISSQFISALLMVAPRMSKGLVINIQNEIVSKPYILLTLELMKKYGVLSTWNGDTITIENQNYLPCNISVERDWSAASYWYSFVSILPQAKVKLVGLTKNSIQGDSKVANIFDKLGVETEYTHSGVVITKSKIKVKKIFYDFINEPDLVQTFAVSCCSLDIPFSFAGVGNLRIKETDRIMALIVELKKLGFVLTEDRERGLLEWSGEKCLAEENPTINTYDDHRMAMSFAPASLLFPSMKILDPDVVKKSYPLFWDNLLHAGFTLVES